jgi:hypothetical protein
VHTPIKFYVILPVDLFRGGTPTKHKFDYIRTMPPRKNEQVFDIKINPITKKIDHTSGGLSLFNTPNYSFGNDWWVVPAGTQLPLGFTLSKDLTNGKFKGHYTIRAMSDISLNIWKQKLVEWADEHVIHVKEYIKVNKHV